MRRIDARCSSANVNLCSGCTTASAPAWVEDAITVHRKMAAIDAIAAAPLGPSRLTRRGPIRKNTKRIGSRRATPRKCGVHQHLQSDERAQRVRLDIHSGHARILARESGDWSTPSLPAPISRWSAPRDEHRHRGGSHCCGGEPAQCSPKARQGQVSHDLWVRGSNHDCNHDGN